MEFSSGTCRRCRGEHVATAEDVAGNDNILCVCPCCVPVWVDFIQRSNWDTEQKLAASEYVERRCFAELEARMRYFTRAEINDRLAVFVGGGK